MHVQNGVSFFLPIFNFPVPLARSLPPVPVVVSSEAANDWTTSLQFRAGKNSVLLPVLSLSTRFLKGTPYFNLGKNDACIFRACLKDSVCRIIRHWSGWWFIRRSSQVPNQMHTLCIHWIYDFFPQYRSFLRSCHAQNTKLRKISGKEEQSCSSCFKNRKYTCLRCRNTSVCLVLSSRMMKLSRAAKQAVQSNIVSHVSEKLSKRTKRWNASESGKNRDLQKQEERSTKRKSLLWRENMVSDPGLSLSPYMK